MKKKFITQLTTAVLMFNASFSAYSSTDEKWKDVSTMSQKMLGEHIIEIGNIKNKSDFSLHENGYIQFGNNFVSKIKSVHGEVIELERDIPEDMPLSMMKYSDKCEIPVLDFSTSIDTLSNNSSLSINPNEFGMYANGRQQTHLSYDINLLDSSRNKINLTNSQIKKIIEHIVPYITSESLTDYVCRSDIIGTSYTSKERIWYHGVLDKYIKPITGNKPTYLSLSDKYANLHISIGAVLKIKASDGKIITIKTTENAERQIKPLPAISDHGFALMWDNTPNWWGIDWRAYWAGRNRISLTTNSNNAEKIKVPYGEIETVSQRLGTEFGAKKTDIYENKTAYPWWKTTGNGGTWYGQRVVKTNIGDMDFIIKGGVNRPGSAAFHNGCVDHDSIQIIGKDAFGNDFILGDFNNAAKKGVPMCFGAVCTVNHLNDPNYYGTHNCSWERHDTNSFLKSPQAGPGQGFLNKDLADDEM